MGIGNALVDIMTKMESDSFLDTFGLQKASMQLVDLSMSARILEEAKGLRQELASGGSAANTIHGLARLGAGTVYIGKTGDDEFGRFFGSDMEKSGIRPILLRGSQETGRAIALVSPDSERTFATCLGSAVELSADDLDESYFSGCSYMHIEGYLVFNQELIEAALAIAGRKKMTISLDLASYNVVEQKLGFLRRIVKDHVHIVFANEDEARVFTGKRPDAAVNEIGDMCHTAIVKTGETGSLIVRQGELSRISSYPATPADTTGAGDIYAAGYLYGCIKGYPAEISGQIGSYLAARVIEHTGAKIPDARWPEMLENVNRIVSGKM